MKAPREFVFMDRAAIGLGGVFLHLAARLNWHDMFNDTIEGFVLDEVSRRQQTAPAAAGVPLPESGEEAQVAPAKASAGPSMACRPCWVSPCFRRG